MTNSTYCCLCDILMQSTYVRHVVLTSHRNATLTNVALSLKPPYHKSLHSSYLSVNSFVEGWQATGCHYVVSRGLKN